MSTFGCARGAGISQDDETTVYTVVPTAAPPVVRNVPLPPVEQSPAEPPVVPAAMPPAAMPPFARGTATYGYRHAGYGTTARVVFAGVVLLLFGAAWGLGGAAGAVFARNLRRVFDDVLRAEGIRVVPDALVSVITGIFVALLVVGVLHMAAAAGVFSHRTWGRVLGFVLCLVGVLAASFLLGRALSGDTARTAALTAALGLLVPYGVSLLALTFAGDHFRSQRRRR